MRKQPLFAASLAAAFLAAAGTAGTAGTAENPRRPIEKTAFGRAGAESVNIYTLTNSHGIEARIMTYGATLVSLRTPDRAGRLANIVLGFDDLAPYLAGVPYFGATVGRYANRIAHGRFTLDGKVYQLAQNDGPNSLHGGVRGFDKRVWQAESLQTSAGPALRLSYLSAAGEEGYPGSLAVHVTYLLSDDDTLSIEYQASGSAATPVNLTNHAYFNLTGDPHRSILDHVLTINADRITPVDPTLIPTGELAAVADTPFDFRLPHVIGSRIGAENEQLRLAGGYDHNWVLNRSHPASLVLAAVVSDPSSGRSLQVSTTQPGVQFYSGNFLNGKPLGPLPGKSSGSGTVFAHRSGLCLETQHFPDSPNQPQFPSTILQPGQIYSQRTVLAFRTSK